MRDERLGKQVSLLPKVLTWQVCLLYIVIQFVLAQHVRCILIRFNCHRLDSAPLSASLIADWLEVSGNMNIHDIEAALQQELEISSPILTHISP